MRSLEDEARGILADTLRQVDVRRVVAEHVGCDGESLRLGEMRVPLHELDRLSIVAVGKAALPMVQGVLEALRRARLPIRAIAVTNQNEFVQDNDLFVFPGAHPLPDERSLLAADAVLSELRGVDERTAVLFLISGGASAMLEAPLEARIPLVDIAGFYQVLIGSGLPIAAMNTLRKHFSAVKGGRLAEAAAAARMQCTLLVSDVPVHLPDAIGSGPSLPDSTTLADCRELLHGLRDALPASVANFFDGPLCVETPKPDDVAFQRARWLVISSSDQLATEAASAAQAAGFHVEIDNRCDEWEYREAGRYLVDRAADLAAAHGRCCLISVGEVGVTLPEVVGEGGRNQQLALWCACEMTRRGVTGAVLSVGSDGIDGNSQMAGAVCDASTLAKAQEAGLSVDDALAKFNCTPLLKRIGAAIETGPTGMNLRDLRLLVFEQGKLR